MTVLSMTGYGAGQAEASGCAVEVEIRTVNHRHADVKVRADPRLSECVSWLDGYVRTHVVRGRADVAARLTNLDQAGPRIDMAHARQVYAQLSALRDELAPAQALPIHSVLSVPGLFTAPAVVSDDETKAAIRRAADAALASVDEMRSLEGVTLASDLEQRLDLVERHRKQIEERQPQVVQGAHQRMRTRIQTLLDRTAVPLDDSRIEHEIAVFADRCDISEELTRLDSHISQFRVLLGGTQAVGRKLDFLLQEMGREVNTMGSKANDAQSSHHVVELKAELERIREQVQNVL